ncbi:MAG TPA: hypothetical protein VHD56_18470 [Tepidisphaeraceae bacterium]|nr:hypothetical protein [Tepidisphaeraceae bacterium]
MCNTYGTWLRGDHRGWRERHHRKHVDGDYKHPPAKGTFERILKQSKDQMKREPVHLDHDLREVALHSIVECLAGDGIAVLVACLNGEHLHILAQFQDRKPRQRLGWAKLSATKSVKEFLNAHGAVDFPLELKQGEGIWGKRSECIPIKDRKHRLQALEIYIRSLEAGIAGLVESEVAQTGSVDMKKTPRQCRGRFARNSERPRRCRGVFLSETARSV